MTVQTFLPQPALTLTADAIRHLEMQVREHPGTAGIRISTQPSGCSGYRYAVDRVAQIADADLVLQASDHLTLYIAPDSLPLLQGTELDYVKQGLNATLQFRNPNVTSECGCGESFSVTK